MAMTIDELAKKFNAEYVGGDLLIGAGPTRMYLARCRDGVYSLSEEGKELAAGATLEATVEIIKERKKKAAKEGKVEAPQTSGFPINQG